MFLLNDYWWMDCLYRCCDGPSVLFYIDLKKKLGIITEVKIILLLRVRLIWLKNILILVGILTLIFAETIWRIMFYSKLKGNGKFKFIKIEWILIPVIQISEFKVQYYKAYFLRTIFFLNDNRRTVIHIHSHICSN